MKIIGHQKQIDFLINSAKANFISQVYLFYGQSSVGKKRVALEFSKFIETKNGFKDGIEENPDCKDIERGVHPDLKIISPQVKSDKGRLSISIEEIKKISTFLDLKPLRVRYKIIIIDEAHLLNRNAQSALLKTLEDPRPNTIFFLITSYPQVLFPTILSRASKLYFPLVKLKDIESYMVNEKKVNIKKAREIAFFSFGKPGLALNFLSSPQKIAEQKKSFEEFIKIIKSDFFVRFAFAKSLSVNREKANDILENWLKYFRLILISRILKTSDSFGLMDTQALSEINNDTLIKIIQLIQRTKFIISTTNANPKLALENLLINI